MANTGFKYSEKLLKVTNDVNEYPLDINGALVSVSGLPQAQKDNIQADPDYIAPKQDLVSCPAVLVIPCGKLASSGGAGITDFTIYLDNPSGGVVIIDFNAISVPDKLEISSELSGVFTKKATSSMDQNNNYGPFDNTYGTRPTDTAVTQAQAIANDQYIGEQKGAVPTRYSQFVSDTGITTLPMTTNTQQRIWWKYTSGDYTNSTKVNIRVVGYSGTGWSFTRVCLP